MGSENPQFSPLTGCRFVMHLRSWEWRWRRNRMEGKGWNRYGKTRSQLGGASFGLKSHPRLPLPALLWQPVNFAQGVILLLTSKCSTELCHESQGKGWPQGLWCHSVCRGAAMGAEAPPTLIQISPVPLYSRCFHVFRFLPSTCNICTFRNSKFLFRQFYDTYATNAPCFHLYFWLTQTSTALPHSPSVRQLWPFGKRKTQGNLASSDTFSSACRWWEQAQWCPCPPLVNVPSSVWCAVLQTFNSFSNHWLSPTNVNRQKGLLCFQGTK